MYTISLKLMLFLLNSCYSWANIFGFDDCTSCICWWQCFWGYTLVTILDLDFHFWQIWAGHRCIGWKNWPFYFSTLLFRCKFRQCCLWKFEFWPKNNAFSQVNTFDLTAISNVISLKSLNFLNHSIVVNWNSILKYQKIIQNLHKRLRWKLAGVTIESIEVPLLDAATAAAAAARWASYRAWVRMCRVIISRRQAAYGHWGHLYGFSPVWVRWCVDRWSERENTWLQTLQVYGLMPVCRRMWRVSISERANDRSHTSHT